MNAEEDLRFISLSDRPSIPPTAGPAISPPRLAIAMAADQRRADGAIYTSDVRRARADRIGESVPFVDFANVVSCTAAPAGVGWFDEC